MADYEYLEKLNGCKTEQEFKKLWNSKKFNWLYSYLLCKYCPDYFNIWWDSEKYNWYDSNFLCRYCSDYINIWWDAEKYPYYNYSALLCEYCFNYFETWWNSEKFDWRVADALNIYCQDYKHIWGKGYVKWKLKNT